MVLLNSFWNDLSRSARIGLIGGLTVIVLMTVAAFFWVFRIDYQVLFANMSMQDTAVMVGELDRLKIPYKLGEGGTSILVDKEAVLPTRLKLMGKEIPLHGAVGFELFNNTDFGMTEFAQKINYQRALQGELTRTIQSMSEVKEVRVHIAIPEQSLFKQANNRTKAAINLSLKPGEVLRKDQIGGIQRLVAAAVPGMAIQDVTIVDEHGVALTRTAPAEGGADGGASRLDLKKETESYLAQKVSRVLDSSFGPGQAIASVDVSLNMDQVKSTQESVLAAPAENGQAQTGVIVRERENVRDAAGGDNKFMETPGALGGARAGSSQRETEYQVGKRVEQIVAQPGSIQHVQVLAVVRKPLDGIQIEQIRKLIAAAAGASDSRGDIVEVQSLDTLGSSGTSVAPIATGKPTEPGTSDVTASAQQAKGKNASGAGLREQLAPGVIVPILLLLVVVAVGGLLLKMAYRPGTAQSRLSDAERRQALEKLKRWLRDASVQGDTL
jgi:flagellar M-ring protein FliF